MARLRQPGMLAWLHMVRVMHQIGRRASAQLEHYDLTPAQFDVLAQLSMAPGITQQMLADRLLVTKGNVTGLLDRMSYRGLLRRCPNPEDGRSHLLYLTEQGSELAAEVVPAHEALIGTCMSHLTPDQQMTLQHLLRQLERGLSAD